jgi:hypothetical protein
MSHLGNDASENALERLLIAHPVVFHEVDAASLTTLPIERQ